MSEDFLGSQRKWFNAAAFRLGGSIRLPHQRVLALIAGTPDDALRSVRNIGPKGAAWLRTLAPYRPDLDAANKRCATCRHWGGGHRWSSRWPDDKHPDLRADWGDCNRINTAEDDSGAAIASYSCDSAYLTTAPDFGCVRWEAKP